NLNPPRNPLTRPTPTFDIVDFDSKPHSSSRRTKGRCLVSSKKTRFSRRGFLGGIGIGAAGTGLLEREAEASPAAAAVSGPGAVPITLNINGKPVNLKVEPRVTLLDAMRNYMEPPLTGAKRVCDRGTCGACTVIMAG